jgi:hypothetical protein
MPSRFEIIHAILGALDDENPGHWDGDKPHVGVVSEISGFGDVSRSELNKFGRVRRIAPPEPVQRPVAPKPQPAPHPQDPRVANEMVGRAELAVNEARAHVTECIRAVKQKRDLVAQAIQAWQTASGAMMISRTSLVQEEIRREREYKLAVVRGEVAAPELPRRASSYIDRVSGHGGTAEDFVRSQMRHGGYHRGRQYQRGAKLPSDR